MPDTPKKALQIGEKPTVGLPVRFIPLGFPLLRGAASPDFTQASNSSILNFHRRPSLWQGSVLRGYRSPKTETDQYHGQLGDRQKRRSSLLMETPSLRLIAPRAVTNTGSEFAGLICRGKRGVVDVRQLTLTGKLQVLRICR